MTRSRTTTLPYGFTILEALVTLSITSLLFALLLPAISMARESVRRAKCSANLRSLGTAIHLYHDQYRRLPHVGEALLGGPGFPSPPALAARYFSIHARLLPFVGEHAIAERINLDVGASYWQHTPLEVYGALANQTAIERTISTFLCPTDSSTPAAGNSYRGCLGVGPFPIQTLEFPDSAQGPFGHNAVAFSRILDGLSHTALMSERVRGSDADPIDPQRDVGLISTPGYTGEAFRARCAALSTTSPSFSKSGWTWFYTGPEFTLYNHMLAPNSSTPDCATPDFRPFAGLFSARSFHPGGVNVLLGDGSVRFVQQAIDLPSWHSIATRSSNDHHVPL